MLQLTDFGCMWIRPSFSVYSLGGLGGLDGLDGLVRTSLC